MFLDCFGPDVGPSDTRGTATMFWLVRADELHDECPKWLGNYRENLGKSVISDDRHWAPTSWDSATNKNTNAFKPYEL